jgi:hypothetical protein
VFFQQIRQAVESIVRIDFQHAGRQKFGDRPQLVQRGQRMGDGKLNMPPVKPVQPSPQMHFTALSKTAHSGQRMGDGKIEHAAS